MMSRYREQNAGWENGKWDYHGELLHGVPKDGGYQTAEPVSTRSDLYMYDHMLDVS
jgi:hypothetical protein